VNGTSATSASDTHCPSCSSNMARVADRRPRILADRGDRRLDRWVFTDGDGEIRTTAADRGRRRPDLAVRPRRLPSNSRAGDRWVAFPARRIDDQQVSTDEGGAGAELAAAMPDRPAWPFSPRPLVPDGEVVHHALGEWPGEVAGSAEGDGVRAGGEWW
jgi:hypothetical protein